MSPEAIANFNYSLPNFDFDTPGIYNLPKTQPYMLPTFTPTPVAVTPITTIPVVATPVVPKKTIAFTVYDEKETLPEANIAIDGVGTAQTNGNGYVVIPNVPINATVQITYIGYEDYIISASSVPAKVVLKSGTEQLQEVVIHAVKKPAKSSNWAWWLLGAVVAGGIIKYSKAGTKIVQAKL
jgi:hypothetical protein